MGALVVGWVLLPLVPLPAELFQENAGSLEVVDRLGRPLRAVRVGEVGFARRVSFDAIAPELVEATLAAEDKRFWRHPGVDGWAIGRALAGWVRHGRVVSGGSTITQQLVKQAHPRPRTLGSKAVEAMQALRLEQVWGKQRILREYLNRVDYGNLNVGCASAAWFYFQKPPSDLSLAESAFLAGLPQAPSRLNPLRHFERARRRQAWILERMELNGFITAAERERAAAEPLRMWKRARVFQAPHFVDLLLSRLDEAAGVPGQVRGRLPTTLDLELNHFVEETLRANLARLREQRVGNGAVVVLDNRTGGVLALVGSEDYFSPQAGQVNGAWAARSAGSTLKPFTYLLALERGATPSTVVDDLPVEFLTSTGVFAPVNYDRRCYGPMRYRLALANSLNIAAVKVLDAIGGPAVLQERLQACGLTTVEQPAEFYGLGLTIGNAEVRLLELVNAYACLARLGEFKPCSFSPMPGGRTDRGGGRRVCDPEAAWLIADMLSDNEARALTFGLEGSLRFDFPVACKTGTSSDFRDNWAVGYTPEFTVGVWVGNFDGTPMEQVSGVTGAAPVLHAVFEHLHHRYGTSWYPVPAGIVVKKIHPITGKRVAADSPPNNSVLEKFQAGVLPEQESPDDYDAAGRVLLAADYRDWVGSGDNWLGNRVAAGEATPAGPLRLVSPRPGTVFFLDPDLPDSSRRIPLQARGGEGMVWSSMTLECGRDGIGPYAVMRPGRHELSVERRATGERLETWVMVEEL